jgi:hypothetical protein
MSKLTFSLALRLYHYDNDSREHKKKECEERRGLIISNGINRSDTTKNTATHRQNLL